ncbi:MAG TPA: glycosyltransferase [Candidatus Dojkabacteria bacterium]|nr:glycosyltransferase [Candidatus Dojkabacteria bacterium]
MTNLKSKNILYITHAYKDWIKDPIEVMAKEFNHVYVLVRYHPISDILGFLNIPTLKIYSAKYKLKNEKLPKNVTVLPVKMWYVPTTKWIDQIGDYHFNEVEKIIKEQSIKFDIVHSHIVWSAGYVGMKLKDKYNVPFVLTAHGRDIYQRPYESKLRMETTKKILKSADKMITVSNFLAKEIFKIAKRKDIEVIPNGFKESKFKNIEQTQARKKLKLSLKKKIIVTVGNIEPIKGHKYLIEAAKEIIKTKEYSDVLFVIIGNGPDRSKIEGMVKNLGLQKNFIFTGIVPNEKIGLYNSAADLFVLPSLGEGNPTVMFEALACGLPFIGTNVGGIPEIITKDCGYVVESKNVKELIESITKGLKKKWNKKKIIDYAKQFEWNNICKKILKVYRSL